jgi:Raf kinase inhibitor-like YbhB/YbcL family protein
MPIAFALDGYPIFGLEEPDGSAIGKLDECHGHLTSIGYHYHAATNYPYVFAAFRGTVVEAGGQVDPQPRAGPMRGAGAPLRGAKITGFAGSGTNSFKLSYELNGESRAILYSINPDGTFPFEYQNGSEGTFRQTYSRQQGGEQGRPGLARLDQPPREDAAPPSRPQETTAVFAPSAKTGSFVLRSPAVADGGALPVEFTGDGASASPPLEWSGAPAGTKSYALIMHHLDPEGRTKIYWTLFNIPADITRLEKNAKDVGTAGLNSIHNNAGYAPPHSKGPGPKKYILTLYALSAAPRIDGPASAATADMLLAAMKDHVLASTDLGVIYTRSGTDNEQRPPPPRDR